MGGLVNAVFGDGESSSNTTVTTAPPSPEEAELIKLNTQLAQKQLENINNLQPFQQKLLELSMNDLDTQLASSKALNAAVTPEQQAALAKQDYDRALKMGPIQDELLQRQLDEVRRGGAATPEQLDRIKAAADAGISAGSADIDASTQRGIGLISDELANSRGLRLSDSPIGSEAALLAREGQVQKGSLIKNLRAGQASAALNYPLAAGQLISGMNLSQQNVTDAAKAFQAELRQRAFQNRMTLSGQSSASGIGLAGLGNGAGVGAQSALASTRGRNVSGTGFDPAATINSYGNLARGIGMSFAS